MKRLLLPLVVLLALGAANAQQRWEYARLEHRDDLKNLLVSFSVSFGDAFHTGYGAGTGQALGTLGSELGYGVQIRNILHLLDLLGADGWELVSVMRDRPNQDVTTNIYLFKRPVE